MKLHKNRISIPGYIKDIAMMDAVRNCGRVDRNYIRSMDRVIKEYEKKRNDSMKKMNRSTNSDD